MNNVHQYFHWIVVSLAMVFLGSGMIPPGNPPDKFHLAELGTLPVVDRGRPKPLDTVARTSLMIISGRQYFVEEIQGGEKNQKPSDPLPEADPAKKSNGKEKEVIKVSQPAIRWLMDVIVTPVHPEHPERFRDGPALKHKVFRIENEEVLSFFNLEPRPGFRYSLEEMMPRLKDFYLRVEEVGTKDAKKLVLYEAKLMELAQHMKVFLELSTWRAPHVIPLNQENWLALEEALQKAGVDAVRQNEAGGAWLDLISTYHAGQIDQFNATLVDYKKYLEKEFPNELGVTRFETFFNHFAPFYQCAVLYLFVLILACMSWLVWSEPLSKAAFWLGMLTLLVHTWALIARMYIQGRPPVTNLYSSAIFIGWGCVVLGLFLEYIYQNGVGSVVGAITGSLSLVIAHYLAQSGDTLEMMQAVLDTNFWLATHVTCITLGYTATFMAGFLGIAFVLLGPIHYLHNRFPRLFPQQFMKNNPNLLAPNIIQNLNRMIYGVVCFATLLSFTGTVLGGIWADQSWGRFWGWDPKENGALLIVIWNALILHARWGGMVKAPGIAVLAILGNIVTSWSWFGVNMLGVGLHSYGFMEGAIFWLLTFVFSQLIFAGIGLIPLGWWQRVSLKKDPPAETLVGPSSEAKKDAIMAAR
jgi:cytochrome c-type biogenesis protein CcsB